MLTATLAMTADDVTATRTVRWSRNNRRQSDILTREGIRHAASVGATDWEVTVTSTNDNGRKG